MAMLGQASGGFTESSSALRILHLGIRNTVGQLCEDAYTQTNPPVISDAGTVSSQVDESLTGVLSGSVAFTRPDEGENYIGGPNSGASACVPLGVFINSANGNSFENTPGASLASNKGPYVSGQGTYANGLFETETLSGGGAGDDLSYAAGDALFASQNGYLTNSGVAGDGHEAGAGGSNTTLAILKMAPDATQDEIVYDQRV